MPQNRLQHQRRDSLGGGYLVVVCCLLMIMGGGAVAWTQQVANFYSTGLDVEYVNSLVNVWKDDMKVLKRDMISGSVSFNQEWTCLGLAAQDVSVCNSRGICVAQDTCSCDDDNYASVDCSKTGNLLSTTKSKPKLACEWDRSLTFDSGFSTPPECVSSPIDPILYSNPRGATSEVGEVLCSLEDSLFDLRCQFLWYKKEASIDAESFLYEQDLGFSNVMYYNGNLVVRKGKKIAISCYRCLLGKSGFTGRGVFGFKRDLGSVARIEDSTIPSMLVNDFTFKFYFTMVCNKKVTLDCDSHLKGRNQTLFEFVTKASWKVFINQDLMLSIQTFQTDFTLTVPKQLEPNIYYYVVIVKSPQSGLSVFINEEKKYENSQLIQDWDWIQPPLGLYDLMGRSNNDTHPFEGEIENFEVDPGAKDDLELKMEFTNATYGVNYVDSEFVCSANSPCEIYPVFEILSSPVAKLVVNYSNVETIEIEIPDIKIPPFILNHFNEERDLLQNFISVSFNNSDRYVVYVVVRSEITETGVDQVTMIDLHNKTFVIVTDIQGGYPIEEYVFENEVKCNDGYYGEDCKFSNSEDIITICGDPFFKENHVYRNISQFNSTDSSVHVQTVYFLNNHEFYITNHSRFLVKDCSLVDGETILLFDKSLNNDSDYFMILYKKVDDHYVEDVYISLKPKSGRISNNARVVMVGERDWILVDIVGDEMIYFILQIETGNVYPLRVIPNLSEQSSLELATHSTNETFIQLFVKDISNNSLTTTLVTINNHKDIIISENDIYFEEFTFFGNENVSLMTTHFPLIYITVKTDEFLYVYESSINGSLTRLVGKENINSILIQNQFWFFINDNQLLLIDNGELRLIQTNTSNLVKVSNNNYNSLLTIDDFDQVIERFNIIGFPFINGDDISIVELNYENGKHIQRNISFIHNISMISDTIVTESPLSIPCRPNEILLMFYQPNNSFSIKFEKETDLIYRETMMIKFKPRVSLSSSFKVIHLDEEIWFGMDYFKTNISYFRISKEEVVGYDDPISLENFGFTQISLAYLHSITIRNGTDFMNYIASVSNSSVNVLTVSGGRSKPLTNTIRNLDITTEPNSIVKVICDRNGTNLYLLVISNSIQDTSLIELFRFNDEQLVQHFIFESSVISIRKDREPTSKWFIIGRNGIIVIDLDEIQNPLVWFSLDFEIPTPWKEDHEIFYYQPVIDTPVENNVTFTSNNTITNNSIVSNGNATNSNTTDYNFANSQNSTLQVLSNSTATNFTTLSQNNTFEKLSNNTSHLNITEYTNKNTTYSHNSTIERGNTTFIELNVTITSIKNTTENIFTNITISVNQTHGGLTNNGTVERNNSSTLNVTVDGSSNTSAPIAHIPVITCFGKQSYDNMTCSYHGVCVSNDTCHCLSGYVGIMCEIPICFGLNATIDNVCNGNGKCIDLDVCDCEDGFSGSKCQFKTFVETQCSGSFVKSDDFVIINQDLMYESVLTDQQCGKSIVIGRLNITSIPFNVINSTSKTEIISNLISTYDDDNGNLYISFHNSLQILSSNEDELFFKVIDLNLFQERVLQLPISNIDDPEYSKIATPHIFGQVTIVNVNGDLFGLTVSSIGYVVAFSIHDDHATFLAVSSSITTYSLLSKGNVIYSQNKILHSKYIFITSDGTASLITLGAGQTNFTTLSAPAPSDNSFSILITNPDNGKQFWFTLSKDGVNVSSIVPNIEAEKASFVYLASDKDFTATNEKELKVETSAEYTIISNIVTGMSLRVENIMLQEVSNIFDVSMDKSTSASYFSISDSTTEKKLQIDNISSKIIPTYEPMVFAIYGWLDLQNTQLELNLKYREESIASFKVVKTGTNEYSTLIQSIQLSHDLENLGSFEVNSEIIIRDNTYSTSTFIPIPFKISMYNRVRVVDIIPKVAFKGENVFVQGSFYPSNRLSARISYSSQSTVTIDVEAQYLNSTFSLLVVPDLVGEVNIEVNIQIMIQDMNIITTANDQSILFYVDPEITVGKYSLDQFVVENIYNISGITGSPLISNIPSSMLKSSLLFKLDKSYCNANTSSEITQVMTSSTIYDLSKQTILDMRFLGLNEMTKGSIMQLWFVKQHYTISIDLQIDQNMRTLVLKLPNEQSVQTNCDVQENTHYQIISQVQNGEIQIKIYDIELSLTLCSVKQEFSSGSLDSYGMAFGQSIDCETLTRSNSSDLIALQILASYQKCASCSLKTTSIPSSIDSSMIAGLSAAGVILLMTILIVALISFIVNRIRKRRMRSNFVYYDKSNEGAQETLADLFNTLEGLSSNETSEMTANETFENDSDVSLYNAWV